MRPLRELPVDAVKRVAALFTDIDDTLTTDGKLPAESYRALWALHEAGIAVVPVTGRPAGWCDHFARMWPIKGIVGENGAFYFAYDDNKKKMKSAFVLDESERKDLKKRLEKVKARILREVEGSDVASDQPYRIHDLAIDFCEDVPRLSDADVARIVQIFESEGATAKVSSIHVNGWFGRYDKLGMICRFGKEQIDLNLDLPASRKRAVYVGDSPNDEPAFRFFELSIGVANVKNFEMKHPPRFVSKHEGGAGFAEIAKAILKAR